MTETSGALLKEIDEILEMNNASIPNDKDPSTSETAGESGIVVDEANAEGTDTEKEKPGTGGDIADESEYWANQAKKVRKVVKVTKEDPKVKKQQQTERMARLSNAKIKVPKVQVDIPPKPFSSVKIKKNAPQPSSVYDSSIIQLEDNTKVVNAPPKGSLPNSAEIEPKKKPAGVKKGTTPKPESAEAPVVVPTTPDPVVLDSENFDNEMSNIVRRINLVNSKINQEEVKIVKQDGDDEANGSPVVTSLNNGLSNYAGAFQVNSVLSVVSGNSPVPILSPKKSNSDGSTPSEWYDEMESTFPDLGETNEQVARAVSYSEQQIDKVTGTLSALRKDEIFESAERELTAESSVQEALKAAMEKVADALKRGEITDLRYETEEEVARQQQFQQRYYEGEEFEEGDEHSRSGLLSKIDEVEGEDYSAPNSLQGSRHLLHRSGSGSIIKTPRSGKSVMFSEEPPDRPHYELDEEEQQEQQERDAEWEATDKRHNRIQHHLNNDDGINNGEGSSEGLEEDMTGRYVPTTNSSSSEYVEDGYMARIAAHKQRIALVMEGLSSGDTGGAGKGAAAAAAPKNVVVKSVVKVPREFIDDSNSGSSRRTPEETTTLVINTSADNADIFASPLFDNSLVKEDRQGGGGAVKEAKGPYEPASDTSHNDFVSDADLSRIEEAFLAASANPSPSKPQTNQTKENPFADTTSGDSRTDKPETQLPPSGVSEGDANYVGGGMDRFPYVSSANDSTDVVDRLMALSNSIMNIEKNYENIEHNIENYMGYRVSLTPSTAELNFRADVDDVFGSGAAASVAAGAVADGAVPGRLGGVSIYKTEDAHLDPTVEMPMPVHYQQMNHMVQKQQSRIRHIKDALNSLEEAAVNQDADLFEIPQQWKQQQPHQVRPSDPSNNNEAGKKQSQQQSKTVGGNKLQGRATPPIASKSVPTGQFMKPTAASARRNMNVEKNIALSMANNIVVGMKNRRVSKSGGRGGGAVLDDDDSERGDGGDLGEDPRQQQRRYLDRYSEEEYFSSDAAIGSGNNNGPTKKKKKGKKKKRKQPIAIAALGLDEDEDEEEYGREYGIRDGMIEEDLFKNLGGYLEQQQKILKKNKALNYNQLLSKASVDMRISSNSESYADRELAAVLNSKKKRQLDDERLLQHFQHLGKIEQRIMSTMQSSNDVNRSSIVGYTNSKIEQYQQNRMLEEFRKSRDGKELYRRLELRESGYDSAGAQQHQQQQKQMQYQHQGNQRGDMHADEEEFERSNNERYYNPYNQPLSESNAANYYKFSYGEGGGGAGGGSSQAYNPQSDKQHVHQQTAYDDREYDSPYHQHSHRHQQQQDSEDIRSDYKLMQQAQNHSNNYEEDRPTDKARTPNISPDVQAEFQSYQDFLREHQAQYPPASLSIKLDPPSPSYKASSYHPIPAASSVISAVHNSTAVASANSHSSPQHSHHSPSSQQQHQQSHQYQAVSVLPKINFKISDALLKDPEPFSAKIEKSARGSFVVDSHELSPRGVINRKTNQPKGATRFMDVVHSHSGGAALPSQQQQQYSRAQHHPYASNDEISDLENDEVSLASSSVNTTANNTEITGTSHTKRTSADDVYSRLKNVNKKSPRTQRVEAEKELSLMIKRQHEYDIIANQINVNLNNQGNQQHTNKLLADNKLPASNVLSEADDLEVSGGGDGGKESAVRDGSVVTDESAAAAGAGTVTGADKAKKTKGIAVGGAKTTTTTTKKKKKRAASEDDYDSDDFEEIIAQSMKVLDVKPPKSVKPSNQNNPRLSNLKYKGY